MNIPFYWCCRYALKCFFLLWNRLRVVRQKPFPPRGQGLIIAANHRSFLDPPVVAASVRRPLTFLAKAELFEKHTGFSLLIRLLGAIPIASESDFRSIRTVIRALQEGKAILMFPEGTRSPAGEFLEPKAGVAFLARAAGVPVVPCYLRGTSEAMPRGEKGIRPARISVLFGEPYSVPSASKDAHARKGEDDGFHSRQIMEHIEGLGKKVEL